VARNWEDQQSQRKVAHQGMTGKLPRMHVANGDREEGSKSDAIDLALMKIRPRNVVRREEIDRLDRRRWAMASSEVLVDKSKGVGRGSARRVGHTTSNFLARLIASRRARSYEDPTQIAKLFTNWESFKIGHLSNR
jgi:hypothetical protein